MTVIKVCLLVLMLLVILDIVWVTLVYTRYRQNEKRKIINQIKEDPWFKTEEGFVDVERHNAI